MSWQKILAQGFSSSKELLEFLELPGELFSDMAERQFKTRVPRAFVARIEPGNARDPLLLQVLASTWEEENAPDFVLDSLEEKKSNPRPGLLHKYEGRVLLLLTGVCAIHCRYCFRRHFPYKDNKPGRNGLQEVFDYIRQDPSIQEVILSGGDPLLAPDSLLADVIKELEAIPHLKILRFHTRVPIVLTERITESFLSILQRTRLSKVMVLHCNHAQEIDAEVKRVCLAFKAVGCYVLNQAVLLKGINDEVDILVNLSNKLFDCGVLPYYLHVLDKVAGAMHFDLPESRALALYQALQARLPGYLLPRLVREEPGKRNKTLLI